MAIPTSGQISFSQLRSEFGVTGEVSFSKLYRNGAFVGDRASNGWSSVVSKTASIPTSGQINLSAFRGTENLLEFISGNSGSPVYPADIFGSAYSDTKMTKKFYNNGTAARIHFTSGGRGKIELINNGEIQGIGGGPGAAGTPALYVDSPIDVYNYGAIRGGGGGGGNGGRGGTGGNGYYVAENWTAWRTGGGNRFRIHDDVGTGSSISGWEWELFWDGPMINRRNRKPRYPAPGDSYDIWVNGYFYQAGSRYGGDHKTDNLQVRRMNNYNVYTSGGAGGAGGGGGRGVGYGQTRTDGAYGAGGSAGGANAGHGGTGGRGGHGGNWGAAGTTGDRGATGNAGNNGGGVGGEWGTGGGAGGRAIVGSGYTIKVTGTMNGAY